METEEKMKIVINNYFKTECSVNTSIREAFEKGFRIGASKVQKKHGIGGRVMLKECEHKTTEEPTPTPFDAVPREFLYIKETYIDFDPYYTIVYKAHGETYEGFGSFSISNISAYLRLYFIPQLKREGKNNEL